MKIVNKLSPSLELLRVRFAQNSLTGAMLILIYLVVYYSQAHGQDQVTAFTCYPDGGHARYCRAEVWDDSAIAFGGWKCSNWGSLEVAGMYSRNFEYCENNEPIFNVAQVGKYDTYVDGYNESDSWGPVLRTLTSEAVFCDRSHTDRAVVEYVEGCDPPPPSPTPTPGGGGGGPQYGDLDYRPYCMGYWQVTERYMWNGENWQYMDETWEEKYECYDLST